VKGSCIEAHDLAIAKLVAGREKDLEYVAVLGHHGMVQRDLLLERLAKTAVVGELRGLVEARIRRI
jgi:hypothetical protein